MWQCCCHTPIRDKTVICLAKEYTYTREHSFGTSSSLFKLSRYSPGSEGNRSRDPTPLCDLSYVQSFEEPPTTASSAQHRSTSWRKLSDTINMSTQSQPESGGTHKIADNTDQHDRDNGLKAEAPVAEKAPSQTTTSNAAAPAARPPGFNVLYPGYFVQAVLIVGLLLAMFLVALNMLRSSKWPNNENGTSADYWSLLEHHCNGYPHYHGRVPQRRPSWLVRIGFLHVPGSFPGLLGQDIQILPTEGCLLACIIVFELGS